MKQLSVNLRGDYKEIELRVLSDFESFNLTPDVDDDEVEMYLSVIDAVFPRIRIHKRKQVLLDSPVIFAADFTDKLPYMAVDEIGTATIERFINSIKNKNKFSLEIGLKIPLCERDDVLECSGMTLELFYFKDFFEVKNNLLNTKIKHTKFEVLGRDKGHTEYLFGPMGRRI